MPIKIPAATPTTAGVMTATQAALVTNTIGNLGVVPGNQLIMVSDPVNGNTVTIGSTIFKYVTALGAPTTFVQIQRGFGAAAARASLVNAINGITDSHVVQSVPAFTEHLFAQPPGPFDIFVLLADSRGGTPIATSTVPSIAFSATLPNGFEVWDLANLNLALGVNSGPQKESSGCVLITPAMVAAGGYNIYLPFTPSSSCNILFSAYDALAKPKYITDQVIVVGNAIGLSVGAGATPFVAGDTLAFKVWS